YLHNIYVPLYLIVYLLWYWKTLRFVVPLVPFIFYYFITGLMVLSRKKQVARIVTGIAILLIFLLNLQIDTMEIRGEQKTDYYPAEWENYFQIADWVKENVPGEAVIMCRKPYLFYLRSGRKTASYPFTRDTGKITASIKDSGADYVVLDAFTWTLTTRKYLYPAVLENKDMFEVAAATEEGPKTLLLRVKPGGEGL
ncbi:MAG: hypothetical protein KAX20_07175, partial [Candidatus Omnitrophica bacterium]|nr:hypothetical protein [Candidatus Omnitrophota bacterium]